MMTPHHSWIKEVLKKNIVYILFGLIISFLLLIDTAAYNICIKYGEFPLYNGAIADIDAKMITYNKDGRGVSEEPIKENVYYYVVLDSSQWSRSDNLLELDFRSPYAKLDKMPIREISFRYLMFELFTIDSENYASFLSGQAAIDAQDDLIQIPMIDDQAWFRFNSNDIINQGSINTKIRILKAGLIIFIFFLLMVFCLLDIYAKTTEQSKFYKWTILLVVILCIASLSTFLGVEKGSPDEGASAAAVKYFFTNWGLPDYRTEEARITFSNYGSSRLKETTLYYQIAGKVGRIFGGTLGDAVASRLFNLFLLLLLFIVFFTKGKNNLWLLIGLVLTPQLWYLFSYATSDAWDYFISYIIILCLVLDNKVKRRLLYSIIRGLLFAILFMGKKNYYVLPLFAFLIYLSELIFAKKEDRKNLIKEYLIILVTTGIILGIKYGIDSIHFQGQRSFYEAIEAEFKQVSPISLRSQGKTLSDLFLDLNLYDKLYKSFAGIYGWMKFESGTIYYFLIYCFYIILLAFVIIYFIKKKESMLMTQMVISMSMIVISFLIVAFHCWTYEYQTQGRYMFGMIPCIMFVFSRDKKLYNSKSVEYLMEGIALLGIYSYIMYSMTHIIV